MDKQKKLRVAVLGMGQRACFHGGVLFGSVRDQVIMAAVCDNRPDRLEYGQKAYAAEFEGPVKPYEDYHKMFKQEKLDGVFIAGPNYLHRDMALAAIAQRINVLCEKPMEVTLARCDEMMAAAEKAGKVLAFGMQMHYRRRYHKVKEIIASGALGAIAQVWCTEYRGPYAEMKDWVWRKELSGGAIVEKNCHHYDLLNWWVGSPPTTVFAAGGIAKHHKPYGYTSEIVDHAWILNNYASGAAGMVGICFLADPKMKHRREFGVHGTEGRIFFSDADGEILHVEYSDQHVEHYDMRENPWLRGGLEADFLNGIRTGEPPLVTGAMAKSSLLVPMAAELSIEEKRVVHVNELA